ncbi:LapA family protein [Vibrio sp. WXL103]|uniref:LapA family protein n=1 Tax=unclassified Vibrio TaxID=2614977 RepID=UPI003EC543BA
MKIIKVLAVIVLFLTALALGSQNQAIVTFNYLLAQGDFHLSTLLGGVFVVGFILAWILFGTLHLRAKLQITKLKRQLKKYEAAKPATTPTTTAASE